MYVFGSQYLRGYTPEKDQWEKDMENMKKLGFNTIRAWFLWNAIEKSEGNFDYDYISDFLTLAGKYDLQVGILFHLHSCPAWFTIVFIERGKGGSACSTNSMQILPPLHRLRR